MTESSKSGFKMNRRKAKMLHKGKKGGDNHNKNNSNNNKKHENRHGKNRGRSLHAKGGQGEKRFKKGNN